MASNLNPLLGGGGRIRTYEGISQQIYSLPPLAAWVPLLKMSRVFCGARSLVSTSSAPRVERHEQEFFGAAMAWFHPAAAPYPKVVSRDMDTGSILSYDIAEDIS